MLLNPSALIYTMHCLTLIYGCNLWGLTSDKNIQQVVKMLQKKCLRIMTFSGYHHPSNELFIDLKILKINDMIKLQQLKLAYEYWNKLLPDDLVSLFVPRNEKQTTNFSLRSSDKNFLSIPKTKTVHAGNRSLRYQCSLLWNHFISNDICTSPSSTLSMNEIKSVNHLKKQLKKHFEYLYTQVD